MGHLAPEKYPFNRVLSKLLFSNYDRNKIINKNLKEKCSKTSNNSWKAVVRVDKWAYCKNVFTPDNEKWFKIM